MSFISPPASYLPLSKAKLGDFSLFDKLFSPTRAMAREWIRPDGSEERRRPAPSASPGAFHQGEENHDQESQAEYDRKLRQIRAPVKPFRADRAF